MARIRTIKPEFFSSPDVARASMPARLLYIGMWCHADDTGRGELNYKQLEGEVFPNDDLALTCSGSSVQVYGSSVQACGSSEIFRALVAEVADVFGLDVYTVNRRTYYSIPSWNEHQRNERRSKSKYPAPDEGKPVTLPRNINVSEDNAHVVAENVGSSVQTYGSSVTGTGEQGNRGTGEQGNSISCANPETDDSDLENEFKEFWDTYPRKKEKARARKAYKQARKHTPPDIILDGARRYAQERTGQDAKYTKHPATWLNNTCWEDEPDPASPPPGRETIQQLRQRKLAEARAYDQAQQQQALSDTEQRKEITT